MTSVADLIVGLLSVVIALALAVVLPSQARPARGAAVVYCTHSQLAVTVGGRAVACQARH